VSAELDLQTRLKESDSGTYVIPYIKLIEMSREHLDSAEKAVKHIFRNNPDYEFCVDQDPWHRTVTIKWRRRDYRTETSSTAQEISGINQNF
jgi:hypothetical protein